ncbi:MAG: phospholipase D-like domain-containing protein [Bacteroidales bacterium]|nr:phospholipase D-like domain-containing protein [Bacteroidales bacterium]
MSYTKYIKNEEHYKEVLSKASKVKEALWIGTADIKDLYVGDKPFLGVLAELVKKGIDVRLIHAKEPGPIFREEFDRYPVLIKKLQRQLCPRVHFKIVVFDYREVYIGSANLTGAGIGAKGANKRNFEAGILTDEFEIVDAACEQFDSVWTGKHCKQCLRKEMCGAPISQ